MIVFFIVSLLVAFLGYYLMITRFNRYQQYPLWQFTLSVLATVFGTYGVMMAVFVFIVG